MNDDDDDDDDAAGESDLSSDSPMCYVAPLWMAVCFSLLRC